MPQHLAHYEAIILSQCSNDKEKPLMYTSYGLCYYQEAFRHTRDKKTNYYHKSWAAIKITRFFFKEPNIFRKQFFV